MTIRNKILLHFFIPGALLIGIVTTAFYFFSAFNLQVQSFHTLTASMRSRSAHISTYLEAMRGRMTDFASDGKIKDCLFAIEGGASVSCSRDELVAHLVANKLPAVEELTRVSTLDPKGIVLASTDPSIIGEDLSSSENIANGAERAYTTDLQETSQGPMLLVSAPVYRQGQKVGYVLGQYSPGVLWDILSERTGLQNTGEMYLVDKEGLMVSPSYYDKASVLRQRVNSPGMQECVAHSTLSSTTKDVGVIEQETVLQYDNYRNVRVLGVYSFIEDMNWCLLAEIDRSEALTAVRDVAWFVTFVSLAIGAMIVWISFWVGNKISKPITDLEQGIEIVARGHLDHRVGTTDEDEVGKLSRTFDRMTEAVRRSHVPIRPNELKDDFSSDRNGTDKTS